MRTPPHLPFMAGPPDFVVGLKPIAPASWLAPDTEADTLPEKRALLATRRGEVFAETEGSQAAQAETAKMVGAADFIAAAGMVSDDFCVMEKRGDAWVLSAASLCAPTFWSLRENI